MGVKMRNAPVYFTIAQSRYNPVLSLKNYMPDIQEHFRKAGYPDFKQVLTVAFNLTPTTGGDPQQDTPPPLKVERYLFSNMESTKGFILQQNALSYQSTEYDTYPVFSSDFLKGLELVNRIVELNFSERVGIRYLDAVSPKKGEDLAEYLVPEVLGIARILKEGVIVHSFSETAVKVKDLGQVVSRVIIQSSNLGFPPDLQPDGLKLKSNFQEISGLHGIIDTDGAFEGREPFDINKVRTRMDDLHHEISAAFYATVTEHALSVWR